jgi:hypothetical protein
MNASALDKQVPARPGTKGRRFLYLLPALLLLCACEVKSASFVLYTNATAWQTAAGASSTIGFEGLAGNFSSHLYPTPPGLTLSGVNFTINQTLLPTGGALFVLGPYFAYPANSVLEASQSEPGSDNILMTFPQPVLALAMDFGDRSGSGSTFGFTLSDGESFTLTSSEFTNSSTPNDYVGLTFSTPMTSIDIYRVTTGTELDVDNLSFVEVPEPGSSSLMLLGAAMLFANSRRLYRRFR